ncbi:MAG: outer membrane lipoprotein carrier protein LolA [Thermoanaerobaculia bacterium]|nr:MAG: outer membrane lipoprotein carrier protein LolA [Thermoanaerobaculia bacterium]
MPDRDREGAAPRGRRGGGLGRLLPLPRRARRAGCGRRHRGRPAGRLQARRRGDRRCRRARPGDAADRRPPLPALSVRRALLLLALLASASPGGAADAATDSWAALDRLRRELAAGGPLLADFVQTFTPAGFTSGETESGRLALSMPDCLRFDYQEPYRKSFLVCGARAWSWVEGEPRGQRVAIDASSEMGLDLLLLPAGVLSGRYRATSAARSADEVELELEPIDPAAPLVAANLAVAGSPQRPRALDYRDREGNVTSFRFSNWRALDDSDAFSPPPGIEWTEP